MKLIYLKSCIFKDPQKGSIFLQFKKNSLKNSHAWYRYSVRKYNFNRQAIYCALNIKRTKNRQRCLKSVFFDRNKMIVLSLLQKCTKRSCGYLTCFSHFGSKVYEIFIFSKYYWGTSKFWFKYVNLRLCFINLVEKKFKNY